jgi:hypothetical protein
VIETPIVISLIIPLYSHYPVNTHRNARIAMGFTMVLRDSHIGSLKSDIYLVLGYFLEAFCSNSHCFSDAIYCCLYYLVSALLQGLENLNNVCLGWPVCWKCTLGNISLWLPQGKLACNPLVLLQTIVNISAYCLVALSFKDLYLLRSTRSEAILLSISCSLFFTGTVS